MAGKFKILLNQHDFFVLDTVIQLMFDLVVNVLDAPTGARRKIVRKYCAASLSFKMPELLAKRRPVLGPCKILWKGWLKKVGKFQNRWKRRYFVLIEFDGNSNREFRYFGKYLTLLLLLIFHKTILRRCIEESRRNTSKRYNELR